MRVFIYEFCVGGGLLGEHDAVLRTLEPEGRAMLSAVVADFAVSDRAEVVTLLDARVRDVNMPQCDVVHVNSAPEERGRFVELAAEADYTLLIAPELDGVLFSRSVLVEEAGGQLLSPSSEFIKLASDKLATNRALAVCDIRVPRCASLHFSGDGAAISPNSFEFPVVVKRRDGAGSVGMRVFESSAQLESDDTFDPAIPWLVEEWRDGDSVGVNVLCGSSQRIPLPPFIQRFATSDFTYQGGSRLVESDRIERAKRLAVHAIESVAPRARGWVGVDLVLGAARSGADDYVLEVNPRLTTSYIGLRAICETNLAEAMLDVVSGRPALLSFSDDPVEFSAHDACTTSEMGGLTF